MLFLTVSDEVVPVVYSLNARERFGHVDAVLACGDLPYYYLEFIVSTLNVPCLYVHGNHDKPEHQADGTVRYEPAGCVSVEGRSVCVGNVIVAGLGGSLSYNNEGFAQYTERQMALRVWRLVPRLLMNHVRYGRYVDVFLTHAPPLNIHNGPDLPHRGFRVFLNVMDRFKPRYLIHGHIHRSYAVNAVTETRYHETTVINTAGYGLLTVEALPTHNRGATTSLSSDE
jgi:Icc-related predicted phosphoesterase